MITPRRAAPTVEPIDLDVRVQRLGVVLEPDGDPTEAGGHIKPRRRASALRRAVALP